MSESNTGASQSIIQSGEGYDTPPDVTHTISGPPGAEEPNVGPTLPPPVPPMPERAEPGQGVHAPDLIAHLKAWVRRELVLLHEHGMSHEEHVEHNP